MREGWEYKKLGEVASYINGYAFKPGQWKESGTPIVRIQNLNNPDAPYNYYDGDVPDKVKIYNGDLLISWSASLGAYIWKGGNAFLNQHIFKVEFDKVNIDKMFFKYAVTSKLDAMSGQVHGATMKHIVKKDFDNILIPYPPLPIQQTIVDELDEINNLLSLKRKELETYDKLAQSLFYEMFGDPVENQKGWEVKKLGEVCESKLKYGSGASATKYNGDFRYVRITDINEDGTLNDDVKSPSSIEEEYILNEGDIVFARSGATVGKTYLHKNRNVKCIYAGYLIKASLNRTIIHPEYVFRYTQSKRYKDWVALNARAVAQPNINAKQYSDLQIPLPPLPLQQLFASRIEAIEEQKKQVKAAIEKLETLLASRMQYWFD